MDCENLGILGKNINNTPRECGDMFDCCDCGDSEDGCGCSYCYSCNACETCIEESN